MSTESALGVDRRLGAFYGREMFRPADTDAVASAVMSVEYALTVLAHASAGGWTGGAAEHAEAVRIDLVGRAVAVHDDLLLLHALLRELEMVKTAALVGAVS